MSRRTPVATAGLDMPDVLRFLQLIWAVAHGLERTSKRMGAELGVTGPQRLVLRLVGLAPGVSPGELAALLHVHPSTLTGVLQRLVAQGQLARLPDTADRRRAVLRLTARGARTNATRTGTVEASVAAALEGTTAHERRAAERVLLRLAAHLGAAPGTPAARPGRDTRRGTAARGGGTTAVAG